MKKKIWLTGLYLLACMISVSAQEPATGLVFDDEVYDTLSRLSSYDGSKDLKLPQTVDLSPFCPEVRNQGEIFSCVGWAVGYGAMTIRRAIREGWTDRATITANAYSAMFIYNQIREGDCRRGSRLSSAMEFLRRSGDCPAKVFDFNVEDCEKEPPSSVLALARKDTISDYLTLFGRNDNAEAKIWKVKRALAQREPVIIGMAIRQNFYQLKEASYWWPDLGNTHPAGGHAMTVVGYDDKAKAFLLFNSWGAGWGDNGFIRIKYADFAEYCKYAYILIGSLSSRSATPQTDKHTQAAARDLVKLAGGGQLKHLDGYSGREPIFKVTALAGQAGVYQSRQKWPTGQLFQLTAATADANMYLYVFTVDATGEVHVHWPRKEQLNKKFSGRNESALVVESDSRITIPGPNKALRINQVGKDVMYLLFSRQPIKGLSFICSKMSEAGAAPMQHLRQLMGRHLIPSSDIQYGQNFATFKAETRSAGYIVPVILITDSFNDRQ